MIGSIFVLNKCNLPFPLHILKFALLTNSFWYIQFEPVFIKEDPSQVFSMWLLHPYNMYLSSRHKAFCFFYNCAFQLCFIKLKFHCSSAFLNQQTRLQTYYISGILVWALAVFAFELKTYLHKFMGLLGLAHQIHNS